MPSVNPYEQKEGECSYILVLILTPVKNYVNVIQYIDNEQRRASGETFVRL